MKRPRLTAKVSTSFRLTPEQNDAVRGEADRRGVSVAKLLGEIIDEWMLMRGPVAGVQGVNTELGRG